ncbi:hypothetical protein [Sinorhizobium sp. RAC02]|uniref:hypothetical protein n=1 Tax=Sinorhizobium sp. RAC02 TaxID=1842534 RepID=UPI00083DB485|nr:hypothetical protein [Sinorhizobium sp. RAC02]AOF92022.1 hypothetical protein BSY16_8 [Sinorhizobium sp. RAC02]
MSRVRFTEDFDYKPKKSITVAYLAGMEKTVKRECAALAIAAGKAVSLDGSKRMRDDGETENPGATVDGAAAESPREEDHGSGDS